MGSEQAASREGGKSGGWGRVYAAAAAAAADAIAGAQRCGAPLAWLRVRYSRCCTQFVSLAYSAAGMPLAAGWQFGDLLRHACRH